MTYPPYLGRKLLGLLSGCLERDQRDRIGDDSVKAHAFFAGISFEDITGRRVPGPNASHIRAIRDKRVADLRVLPAQAEAEDCARRRRMGAEDLARVDEAFREF